MYSGPVAWAEEEQSGHTGGLISERFEAGAAPGELRNPLSSRGALRFLGERTGTLRTNDSAQRRVERSTVPVGFFPLLNTQPGQLLVRPSDVQRSESSTELNIFLNYLSRDVLQWTPPTSPWQHKLFLRHTSSAVDCWMIRRQPTGMPVSATTSLPCSQGAQELHRRAGLVRVLLSQRSIPAKGW